MKYLFAILIMFVASTSYADISIDAVGQAGFSNLTQEQKAQVIQNITQMNGHSLDNTTSAINPEKIDKWVELGEHIGRALSGAAKELGVAANEFAKTPLGMITIGMIVWNIFGNGAMHFIVGMIFLSVALKMFRRVHEQVASTEITYDPDKKDIFGRSVKIKESNDLSGESAFFVPIGYLMILGAFCIITFT